MSAQSEKVVAAGWGRYPRVKGVRLCPDSLDDVRGWLASGPDPVIPQGLLRSYGDSALAPAMIATSRFDAIESLDSETGLLIAGSGASLDRVLDHGVPRGWFPPVVPGTRYVSLGGAIASDVHGKNHHRHGSFAAHVAWLDLMVASGEVVRCSPEENSDLFDATCGGMGLTGLIVRAAVRMIPIETAFIRQEILIAGDLAEAVELFRASSEWTYSVAWIDCRTGTSPGRAVLFRGEHLTREELPAKGRGAALVRRRPPSLAVPFAPPGSLLGGRAVRAFNEIYYRLQRRRRGASVVPLDSFFFPLDRVAHWNRLYGRRGFIQHQSAIPSDAGTAPVLGLLEEARRSGQGSFLAVLKLFGPGRGGLSFPIEGLTLALDFPVSSDVLDLAARMDRRVVDAGGRIYLTKDARMDAAAFRAGYPEADRFCSLRRTWDPRGRFGSMQAQRLSL